MYEEGQTTCIPLNRASLVAQKVKNLPAMWELRFDPWIEKIPQRREQLTPALFFPKESHGQRSLKGCSPGTRKSRTRLNDSQTHRHNCVIMKYSFGSRDFKDFYCYTHLLIQAFCFVRTLFNDEVLYLILYQLLK